MKIYRCKNCGWYGEDIIKWEEKPRDEFDVMCPKCHYRDSYIEVNTDDGEWEPAYVPYVPTQEEIEAQKRFYDNLNKKLASTNVYLESIYKMEDKNNIGGWMNFQKKTGAKMPEELVERDYGFLVQSYPNVPILVGEKKEEEINERTEWAISDVKKGVFDSEDYGVRGTWYSDLEMFADKDGLHVHVSSDEYCFLFNKRFIIEDMITVLQKCLDMMDEDKT